MSTAEIGICSSIRAQDRVKHATEIKEKKYIPENTERKVERKFSKQQQHMDSLNV